MTYGLVVVLTFACAGNEGQGSEGTATTASVSSTGAASPETTGTSSETQPGDTATTLAPFTPPTFESVSGIHTIGDFSGLTSQGLGLWQESVPGIQDVLITSTGDGTDQPALWLAPEGDQVRPLLVILHSSSSEYQQHAGIPYAMFADENGWAVIAPQFRGVNDHPEALGSDLAVQDVVDAIDFAVAQGGVDANRVYTVGYSGGGTMSLLLAGRHPDKVTAVAAWGPPSDLIAFYVQSAQAGRHYAPDIEAACGGDPTAADSEAQASCLQRSPVTYLNTAREEGVPVFMGHGLHDSLLSPSHSAVAFNQLADPADQLSPEHMDQIAQGILPEDLPEPISTESYFGDGDPAPVLARQSAAVWLVIFDADHEMVYQPTMRWFATDPR
jgi:pimeloyl-ACP methyl ester carboxylesterase